MPKLKPCKKSVKLNCFAIILILALLFNFGTFTSSMDDDWIDGYQFAFDTPQNLTTKHYGYLRTSADGEVHTRNFYIYDCSCAETSFLSFFKEKTQSKYLDFFFERINEWQDEAFIDADERIYPTDDFIWCYACKGDIAFFDSMETISEANSNGLAILVYRGSDQSLYGTCRWEF